MDPTVFGIAVSKRDIAFGFFGFPGIDALAERTGRLSRIERRAGELAGMMDHANGVGEVLRQRSSFKRMDVLAGRPRHSALIIGEVSAVRAGLG
jgi:hypothetical protein